MPRERLHARYGPRLHQHVEAMFAANGLEHAPPPDVVPNTFAALRLAELARDRDRHRDVHDRLMDAYWAESRNIGDADTLRELSRELELPEDDVERVLAGDDYGERVRASTQQAVSLGITGIPGFLLGRRLLVLGAQPPEVFEQAFAQLRSDY